MSEVRMVHCSIIQTHQGTHSLTLLLLLKMAMNFGLWGVATGSELDTVMIDPVASFEKVSDDLRRTGRRLRACKVPAGIPRINVQKTQRTTSPLEEAIANIVPLHFRTHEQAMDVTDYAYVQLLCDEVLLMDFLALATANSTLIP
jgi:hypothetical protein